MCAGCGVGCVEQSGFSGGVFACLVGWVRADWSCIVAVHKLGGQNNEGFRGTPAGVAR